jgi:hypothetical protein
MCAHVCVPTRYIKYKKYLITRLRLKVQVVNVHMTHTYMYIIYVATYK